MLIEYYFVSISLPMTLNNLFHWALQDTYYKRQHSSSTQYIEIDIGKQPKCGGKEKGPKLKNKTKKKIKRRNIQKKN